MNRRCTPGCHGRHRLEDRRGWNQPTALLGPVLTAAQRHYLPGGGSR